MIYKETGKSIVDRMLREGRDEEITEEVKEIQELLRQNIKKVFKIEDLYGEKWETMDNVYKRNLGKRFKAYTQLEWLGDIEVDITSKDMTLVYIKIEPCNSMYTDTKIA